MLVFNIVLVILGLAIPVGTVIFWSKAKKISYNNWYDEPYSGNDVKGNISFNNFIAWLYQHKSKFNILVMVIVTIIEFLALIPF